MGRGRRGRGNLSTLEFVTNQQFSSSMAVTISDDLLARVELSGEELMIAIACFLYEKKRLSQGKARELTGLNFLDFQRELGKRGIESHYSE